MYRIFVSFFLLILAFSMQLQANDNTIAAAKAVIERQIGNRANDIEFKIIPTKKGKDVFAISARDGKLKLSGSSSVAICYAFHKYLREACHSMKTWSGEHMNLPEKWADYECGKQASPYEYRYFLNVCTYGYTTPYWDWARWEKEIDWMAMRGVNMPLASVAMEAIAERVWLKMGLSKESIREFFTGAAYLPWHRMGNLNKWSGPLTDEWQEQQLDLQHKILSRMKELGMEPVVPTFAGFVPMEFAKQHPEIKFNHLKWGGFDESLNAYVLPPDSPYFEKIGKLFVEEWEKEFGKYKYYLSDSFNEMELPVDPNDKPAKLKTLAHYGESIYKSIVAGNPDAVWVTQGWTFGYQHHFWDKESMQALLSKVPNKKMIIIDLGNDYPKWVWHTEQTWKNHNGFYGKNWIFSYVPNFGGKTLMTGDLTMYASSSSEALKAKNKGNLIGFGSAPEGLENNEIVYELLADMGWTDEAINLDTWMDEYCTARYGACPENVKAAWKKFHNSAYSALRSYPRFTWQTVVPDKRRVSKVDFTDEFMAGVEQFLSEAETLGDSELYKNDAVEVAAYYVAVKADKLYNKVLQMEEAGNVTEAYANLTRVVEMLTEIDRLLVAHPTMQLQSWVDFARNMGKNEAQKNKYEADAKRLITTWGGFQEDYAARFWSGLIKDYYIPRILIHFSNRQAELNEWEDKWVETPWTNTSVGYDNPLKAAKELVTKYKNI